uniref:Src homology 2 domain containing transforming protein D n=1 Tax=Varanus komodoensis TaxID=61221 RepID=A0A8D2LSQ4_VARKO
MAKWLKDYLSFGSRRSPPQPPKPDYSESEILKAYRAQKSLDFEDPYEDGDGKPDPDPGGSPNKGGAAASTNLEGKYGSPKHRLIKVEASDLNKSKALLATASEEVLTPLDQVDAELENNGYMEPYDAQKVKSRIGFQLYDTPYEEKVPKADPDTLPVGKPRESRLPQDDERPADEYDQPWEWKKTHISRAFAGAKAAFRSRKCGSKFGRSQSPDPGLPVAERFDPSLPLENQASSQGFMHMKFTRSKENKYILGQNSAPFDSIPEVIHYYTAQELPVKGAEHLSLLYPVAIQTL